jgi:membrane protein
MQISVKGLWPVARDAARKWGEDRATTLSAGLSYYTIFSIAPLLIIVISVAGLVFGQAAVQGRLVGQLSGTIGHQSAQLLQTMLAHAQSKSGSIMATLIGLVTLIIGATGVLIELQTDLNVVWKVGPKTSQGVMALLKGRLLSLGLILAFGFLLLVSLAINAALSALALKQMGPSTLLNDLLQVVNYLISLAVIAGMLGLILKYLPNSQIQWDDVWAGALVTALLFTIGRFIIGLYMSHAGVTSSYGAAGSLVALLLWIYYSALIFFYGAEFTYQYAHQLGSLAGTRGQPEQVKAKAAAAPPAVGAYATGGVAATHGGERHEAVTGGFEPMSTREREMIRARSFIGHHLASVLGSAAAGGVTLGVLLRRFVISPKRNR